MELSTFGAIMGFAMGLEKRAVALYQEEGLGTPSHLLEELVRGSRKRLQRLERARREGVAEMILESITELDSDVYQVEGAGDWLADAIAFEQACARFYRDAADRLPIREISRLFGRLGEENDSRAELLKEHGRR